MTDTILSIAEVVKVTSLSRSSILRQISEGTFPSSIPLGGRRVGFVKSEVDAWIKARIDAARAVE